MKSMEKNVYHTDSYMKSMEKNAYHTDSDMKSMEKNAYHTIIIYENYKIVISS